MTIVPKMRTQQTRKIISSSLVPHVLETIPSRVPRKGLLHQVHLKVYVNTIFYSRFKQSRSKEIKKMAQFKRVDTNCIQKNVWLVKIPKYISKRWENLPDGSDLGQMRIEGTTKEDQQVVLHLKPDTTTSNKEGWNVVPEVVPMDISRMGQVGLAVCGTGNKMTCEGIIGQKFEVRPRRDTTYMSLKLECFKQAQVPKMVTTLLDKAVVSFKPVSIHKESIIDKKTKQQDKMHKKSEDEVKEKLFELFEKHQYYNIRDLVKLTRQPVQHLKAILGDICVYNPKGPQKFKWELRPEYRHY